MPDVDLDREDVRLRSGIRLTRALAAAIVYDIHEQSRGENMDLKDILHEIVNVAAGHGARKDLHDAIDAAEVVAKDAPEVEQVVADVAGAV